MTLSELKTEIRKYQYLEDEGMIDVALAATIASRLDYGRPAWLIIIGPSSGGKSQILRPLSMTGEFMHKVDDLTENTFLSGMAVKEGQGDISLLKKIGARGIIVISDLTVIFSKAAETRAAILSQFRMIYDGEMTKYSGTKKDAIAWKGKLGIVAGATPSVYRTFEEVSDMGQRFIYYRMKPTDVRKPTMIAAMSDTKEEKTDEILAENYGTYIKEVVMSMEGKPMPTISEATTERIVDMAMFAEKIRTDAHLEWNGMIDDVPVPAMPMRLVKQMMSLARAMKCMGIENVDSLEWCAYSLANEKKRACLKIICGRDFESMTKTSSIADKIGLSTEVVNRTLQVMAATGVLVRGASDDSLTWCMAEKKEWETVRRLNGITQNIDIKDRGTSSEEAEEAEMAADIGFMNFGKI